MPSHPLQNTLITPFDFPVLGREWGNSKLIHLPTFQFTSSDDDYPTAQYLFKLLAPLLLLRNIEQGDAKLPSFRVCRATKRRQVACGVPTYLFLSIELTRLTGILVRLYPSNTSPSSRPPGTATRRPDQQRSRGKSGVVENKSMGSVYLARGRCTRQQREGRGGRGSIARQVQVGGASRSRRTCTESLSKLSVEIPLIIGYVQSLSRYFVLH